MSRIAFLRLGALYAVGWLVIWVYGAITIARNGGATKVLGWTAGRQQNTWIVKTVDPNGPAAGQLRAGDHLLSIDGDSAVRVIGPQWILRDQPDRSSYRMTVERDGASLEQSLQWPVRIEPGLAAWLWIHLASGVIYYLVGLIITFAKPESLAARRAVHVAVLSSAFFTSYVLNPNGGMIGGPILFVALVAYFVRPFHLIAGYRFNAAFPLEQPSKGGWRLFEQVLYAITLVTWLPSVYAALLRAMGPSRAVPIAVAQYPFSLVHDSVVELLAIILAAVVAVANALVCWRNYRAVMEPDLKRRMRWVSVGTGVGMIPILLMAPTLLIGYVAGRRIELATVVRVINTITVIMPLCIGYAVVKHRVLGIRVILRAGLRYVLARNVLRTAMLLPVAIIGYTIVSKPSARVSDLVLGSTAKLNFVLIVVAGIGLAFRRPLLGAIDRRFFREAYQQDQIFLTLAEAIGRAADVGELSRLLSTQIQSAIHPRAIFAISAESDDEFSTMYSSSGQGDARALASFHLSPSEFEHLQAAAEVDGIATMTAAAGACMTALGITLLVPIRGPNEGLVGLLLLGEKMSEEPYTRHDRRLLDTTAAQTGVVWENLRLRARLKREQGVRREVVAQLEGSSASMLMECESCGACYDGAVTVCANDGRELSPSMAVPRTLDGKYRLERLIGRGGMGAVYEATDLRLDRIVAVKITTGAMFDDAITMQRFAREARASAKLDHNNVVRAFDFGELTAGAYLVLEFLRGATLRRELQQHGRLSILDARRVLSELFDGIAAAHARHVVHRDIKPENIFLTQVAAGGPPVTKILDFGLAVVRDLGFEDRNRLTQTGAAVGTLAYMSVEQFLGERVDERTDIYALGIVALEMLTGELESRGPTFGRIAGIIDERLCGAADAPEHAELARALQRAVVENRDGRCATVIEFRDAILPVLDRCPPIRGGVSAPSITAPASRATPGSETLRARGD